MRGDTKVKEFFEHAGKQRALQKLVDEAKAVLLSSTEE
jgi:hypothetical protein